MDRIVNSHQAAIEFVSNLTERYQISAIGPLLDSCCVAATRSDLNIAVLGRFKAGKSSFLNKLIERQVLPVGVIPVTSVVTEVVYGPADRLEIRFMNRREVHAPLAELSSYVLGPHQIRVNAICPGCIDTPMMERSLNRNDDPSSAKKKCNLPFRCGVSATPPKLQTPPRF